jgi:hypothetical protein
MHAQEFVSRTPFAPSGFEPSPSVSRASSGLRQAATTLASELLPPRLREFVRLIGLPATLRLIERYGGLRIYIPAHPAPDHPLAGLIGFDKLRALSDEYAVDGIGLRFVLPKAKRAFDAIHNERIRTDFSTGKSVRALAAEHCLVERQVARIVADIAF